MTDEPAVLIERARRWTPLNDDPADLIRALAAALLTETERREAQDEQVRAAERLADIAEDLRNATVGSVMATEARLWEAVAEFRALHNPPEPGSQ